MENYENQNCSKAANSTVLYDLQNDFEYNVLNERELSKENILDFTAGLDIIAEFYDVSACTIIKNAAPCGVALGTDLKDSFNKAFDCNSIAAIGGSAVFSQTITAETAKLAIQYQISAIAAPAFNDAALEVLKYHPEILLTEIKTPLNQYFNMVVKSTTITPFGLLEEQITHHDIKAENFKISSKTKPTAEQIEDMIFAYKIARHLKKSCAVIAKDFKTIAVIGGQNCLPDAIEWGITGAVDGTKDAILGINEQLGSNYAVNATLKGRVSAIICPHEGNFKPVILDAVNKYNIVLAEINDGE